LQADTDVVEVALDREHRPEQRRILLAVEFESVLGAVATPQGSERAVDILGEQRSARPPLELTSGAMSIAPTVWSPT